MNVPTTNIEIILIAQLFSLTPSTLNKNNVSGARVRVKRFYWCATSTLVSGDEENDKSINSVDERSYALFLLHLPLLKKNTNSSRIRSPQETTHICNMSLI